MGPVTPNITALPSSSPAAQAVLFSPLAKKIGEIVAKAFFWVALVFSFYAFVVPKGRDNSDTNGINSSLTNSLLNGVNNVLASSFLEKNGADLTEAVNESERIFGREEKLEEAIGILSQANNANLILVGDKGIGKMAFVLGIARAIKDETAYPLLAGKRLILIDTNSLKKSTYPYSYKSGEQFEDIISRLVTECKKLKNVVLVIDHIDEITEPYDSGLDRNATPLLKNALIQNDVQFIGITTPDKYKSKVERDVHLKDLYQTLSLNSLSPETSVEVLKQKFLLQPVCNFDEGVLEEAVNLCGRYLPNLHLPGGAIEVLSDAVVIAQGNKSSVSKENIQAVVARRARIPLDCIGQTQSGRILKAQTDLKNIVIGQNEAIDRVCGALLRSAHNLRKRNEPIGVFLFAGSTGVGKTLLAEQLALRMFGKEEDLILINLNEYKSAGDITRLIGSPPGYVNHERGGGLTEQVRKKPYSVVLFDEVEKAHPEVHDVLLRLFERGWLEDTAGQKVSFRDTIIILTTNCGANLAVPSGEEGGVLSYEDMEKNIKAAVAKEFRPEFVNRLEMVVFQKIQETNLDKLIDLEMGRFLEDVKGKQIHLSEDAKVFLKKEGFNPKMGVRALSRAIRMHVLTPVALAMTENSSAKSFNVSAPNGNITIATTT